MHDSLVTARTTGYVLTCESKQQLRGGFLLWIGGDLLIGGANSRKGFVARLIVIIVQRN